MARAGALAWALGACAEPTVVAVQPAAPVAQPAAPVAPAAPPVTQPVAPPSFAGTWMARGYSCFGPNPPPPEEQIKVTQVGDAVTATKVVGDDCVPAGAIAWEGNAQGDSFPVQVQVSNGPKTPLHFRPATLTRTGPDTLQVSAGWTLTFRRIGP